MAAAALREGSAAVRVTENRPAAPKEPADLDQRAGIRRRAAERGEIGNDDVARCHHRQVLAEDHLPSFIVGQGRQAFDVLVQRRTAGNVVLGADRHLAPGLHARIRQKHIRPG